MLLIPSSILPSPFSFWVQLKFTLNLVLLLPKFQVKKEFRMPSFCLLLLFPSSTLCRHKPHAAPFFKGFTWLQLAEIGGYRNDQLSRLNKSKSSWKLSCIHLQAKMIYNNNILTLCIRTVQPSMVIVYITAKKAYPKLSKEPIAYWIVESSYTPSSVREILYCIGLPQYKPLGHL